jgi:hypothetical protein
MELIKQHAIFIIPIIVGLLAQFTKYVIYSLKNGWKLEYIFTHGHMPSAHTAFAVSILASVGYYEGLNDGSFAVAVVLGFLIIDDAVRLRVYMGDQGRYLNMLIQQLKISDKKFPRLKERIGHRISEVIVGGILGLVLTTILIALLG